MANAVVKFWKAVIIIQDANNLTQKVANVTRRFDPDDTGEYTVLLESGAKPETDVPVIHTRNYTNELSSWWPQLLVFLFPREQPEVPNSCLFLFDSQSGSTDHQWYKMISDVLATFNLECLWIGDLTEEEVNIDFVVILCQNGGMQMLECSEEYLMRRVKV